MDIRMPEYNFGMRWNLASDGNLWILASDSVNEIGCVHTCQGLEMDYVGVIIGPDFIVRNGKVVTVPGNSRHLPLHMTLRHLVALSRFRHETRPAMNHLQDT